MTVRGMVAMLTAVLVLAGCTEGEAAGPRDEPPATAASSPPKPSSSPSAEPPSPPVSPSTAPSRPARKPLRADAVVRRVPDHQWRRMVATGVWRPGCPQHQASLRRVEVNHYTFGGEVHRGVLVVNRDVAPSVARIFTRLFEKRFPIRRMVPVEVYRGDSYASLRADNTSAYNCRRPDQINAPVKASPHANGRALDINPRENPWVDLRCDCWFPSPKHKARVPGPGKVLKGGVVWRTFRREGWIWQNIDVPDYMHFDTGYPSRPFRR
jgi:hypothetical protein